MSQPECIRRTPFRTLTAAVIFIAAAYSCAGQEPSPKLTRTKWEAGLTLGGAFPAGAFHDSLGRNGYSFGLFGGYRLWNSPFSLGLEFNFITYGSTNAVLNYEETTTNNIAQFLLYIRCQLRKGGIRPYLEAVAGDNNLYTETTTGTYYDPQLGFQERTESDFEDDAFCWGAGLGLAIRLLGPKQSEVALCLDLKVRYLFGGRAKYLTENSIVYENGRFTYLYMESSTNLIGIQASVLLNF